MSEQNAAFYFDLASPLAYIVAELIGQALPAAEWRPVLARDLTGTAASERRPRAETPEPPETPETPETPESPGASHSRLGAGPALSGAEWIEREQIERLAAAAGLLEVRWPKQFPFDSEQAMRAATYAKSIGRTVAFAQAAFRQAFAGGSDLAREDGLLVAAAACELHPRALLAGMGSAGVRSQLHKTTADAARAGVQSVPALRIGEQVFAGMQALERVSAGRTVALA